MNAFCLPVPDDELFALALRAARGDWHLADEALQHLRVQFCRGKYDPARPFRPWAATVIRRYCLDALRPRIRAVGGGCFPEMADPRSDVSVVELGIDLTTPFCREDLRAVRAWKVRSRFVLLGWHGLWGKLPATDQRRTLALIGPAEPFPVPDFFAWSDKDRTLYLARVLRCPTNTVAQIRLRGVEALGALRFVRELRGR